MTQNQLDQLLFALVRAEPEMSDVLFVPGQPPQCAVHGRLRPHATDGIKVVTPELTAAMADVLLGNCSLLAAHLRERGSCDGSYSPGGGARFRSNIYRQSGHLAIVMRRLSNEIPELGALGLPAVVHQVVKEQSGLIFVTGATGMGKTTTLAALLNEVNATQDVHVVTLEDPVEYVHQPRRATFSHRELGRDFFSFSVGLKAALRQAPRVILVGEIRDRETLEVALTAAETGHVVFTTLHTIDAGQTLNRILGMFAQGEEPLVRQRLADTLRWVISQRLVPKIGGGLHLVAEIMGSNLRSREVILLGESDQRVLHDIIESSASPYGWQSFEQALLRAHLDGQITEETAVLHSTHKGKIRQALDQARHGRRGTAADANSPGVPPPRMAQEGALIRPAMLPA
jgi:twitching motility protein PilT